MRKLISLFLASYLFFFSTLSAVEIAFSGLIGDEGSVIEIDTAPTPEGNLGSEGVAVEAVEATVDWQTLATFKITSPYSSGFRLTANLTNAGWSLSNTGDVQDATYNTFTHFLQQ